MAGEALEVVRLRNDFYRDGFYRVFTALAIAAASVIVLLSTILYLYTHKPAPVTFYTDNDLRAFPLAPVTEPYVKQADLIQWFSEVTPQAFTFDFVNYQNHLKEIQQNFTQRGWDALLKLLDLYANEKNIETNKLFVNTSAGGTPTIPNQGIIDGRYGWWIQLPLRIHYVALERHNDTPITLQALVVRVPTTNSLTGLAIDNILVTAATPKGGPVGRGRTNG